VVVVVVWWWWSGSDVGAIGSTLPT